MYCDASDFTFGGYCINLGDQTVQFQSSTYRELKAIHYVLNAHGKFLSNKK